MSELNPAERWLPVVGHGDYYEVSDLGNVRSVDRVVTCKDGRTQRWRGSPLKPTADADSRLQVDLSSPVRRVARVHRLVLEAFTGPCPDGMEGRHNNGDPENNAVVNLRWDTSSENNIDKSRHGTDHNRRKTHCPLEHRLKAPNLVKHALLSGHRSCQSCANTRSNEWYALRQGWAFDFKARADAYYAKLMQIDQ